MMEAVKRGGDRQELHEKIRQHSMAATARMKEGEPCDLLDRLAGDPAFGMTREELDQVMEPKLYIGRCEQQVLRFLDECAPLLRDAAAEDGRDGRAISLASFFHLKKCAAARVALAKAGRIPVSEQIVKGVRSYTKGSECPWIRVSKCAIKKLYRKMHKTITKLHDVFEK